MKRGLNDGHKRTSNDEVSNNFDSNRHNSHTQMTQVSQGDMHTHSSNRQRKRRIVRRPKKIILEKFQHVCIENNKRIDNML